MCAANCGEAFAEIVLAALKKLAAIIQHPQARDEENEAASDNAVGRRCRALALGTQAQRGCARR